MIFNNTDTEKVMGTDIIKVIMKLYDCSFECSNRRHKFPQKKQTRIF